MSMYATDEMPLTTRPKGRPTESGMESLIIHSKLNRLSVEVPRAEVESLARKVDNLAREVQGMRNAFHLLPFLWFVQNVDAGHEIFGMSDDNLQHAVLETEFGFVEN